MPISNLLCLDTFITDGVTVRVYSPEKTIAGCFKYRNKIGLDVAVEALKSYLERSKKTNLKLVLKFAASIEFKK